MSDLAAPGWDEDLLRRTVASLAAVVDGDEPIDELAHALQCATHAMAAGSAPELMAAAFLHDIGRAPEVQAAFPGLPHETSGARWLAPRTSGKVAWLVEAHVPAKVYLVDNDPAYFATLSEESVHSLRRQRDDRARHPAMAELAAHTWWPEALQLRRWDDASKVPGAKVVTIDEILDQLRPAFAPRSA
jgi:predicted HD phosphohydrolase